MTEQLKPCPFCGGINVIHSGYRMYCHACGVEGPDADSADESAAIAAWNRRDQPAQAGAEPEAWIPLEDWRWNNTDGIWEGLAANLHPPARVPLTEAQARKMGEVGGEPTEAERLLFEAWMAGHCWAVSPTWNGREYDDCEEDKKRKLLDPLARMTRMLWAAWRDRAALESAHGIGGGK